MHITFLGTGTSGGVPVINCDCEVCRSDNPKNKRLRSSVMIETQGVNLLIDTSVDMRQQFLRHPFPRIDAVLYTHAHADHIFGLDEIRRFNYLQKEIIPVYGNVQTMERLKIIFPHAFHEQGLHAGVPNLKGYEVEKTFRVKGVTVEPIPLWHGDLPILGYRIGSFAYCTDVSRIPEESYVLLKGLDLLVLDALREKPHPTHFNLQQALSEARKINAQRTYFIHMSHNLDHEKHGRLLPQGMEFSYDGLQLELRDES